jgi:alanyl-tRNA synthetase
MQQHTGQHLLSRCFETVAGAATISFHLGEEEVTIDLDQPDLAPERVADAESLANRTVFANLPVRAVELEPAAAAEMGVAVPAAVGKLVRVVLIGDFDRTACGGTHVAATGEIGPFKVRRVERTRGRSRVAFHCGLRSIADYEWRHDVLRRLASELTTGERELPGLVARIVTEKRDLERRLREVESELARRRVAGEIERAQSVGRARLVCTVVESVDEARALANALAPTPGLVVLAGIRGDRPRLLFAAAEDVPVDLAAVVREVGPIIGGRGGGKARWAEAGGTEPEKLEEALEAAAMRVRAALAG